MRLINFGAGEISDRLTILTLKILHGSAAEKPVEHFQRERAVLLTQIHARTLNGVWFAAVLELAAVNAALWQQEDELRQVRQTVADLGGVYKLADEQDTLTSTGFQIACRIQVLNDRRAELVRSINEQAGDGAEAEKI